MDTHDNLNILTLDKRHFLSGFGWNVQRNPDGNILTRAMNPNRRQLKIFYPRKTFVDKSFSYKIRKTWNGLPDAIHIYSW